MDGGYTLAMNNLAVTLHSMQKFDEAVYWYNRTLETKVRLSSVSVTYSKGESAADSCGMSPFFWGGSQTWRDPGAGLYVTNLGNLLRDRGRFQEAVDLYLR